ncbi:unnamed protein product [Lota lota]
MFSLKYVAGSGQQRWPLKGQRLSDVGLRGGLWPPPPQDSQTPMDQGVFYSHQLDPLFDIMRLRALQAASGIWEGGSSGSVSSAPPPPHPSPDPCLVSGAGGPALLLPSILLGARRPVTSDPSSPPLLMSAEV